MTPQNFSLLAALIFAVVAAVQLARAVSGLSVTIGTASLPLWASWIAVLGAGLAGFCCISNLAASS